MNAARRRFDARSLSVTEGEVEGRVVAVIVAGVGPDRARRGAEHLLAGHRPRVLVSAGFAILTQTRLAVAEASLWFRAGAGATGISGGLSFALMGVGHLVGISVGAAMGLGLVIGWWILLPILTAQHPMPGGAEQWATSIFGSDVRFFGAGVIGVAAVWTLVAIAGPVLGGIRSAMAASRLCGRLVAMMVTAIARMTMAMTMAMTQSRSLFIICNA